jgi:hypothetical protein
MNMLLKTAIALFMLLAWGTLTSCTSKTTPDTHLQQEVDRMQKRTIPSDSRLIDQHLSAIHGWVARADWEFQTNYSAATYNEWLADKLRPDFQIQQGASPSTRFSKHDQGDVEILSVATAPSAGMLQVTVKLEIYPD